MLCGRRTNRQQWPCRSREGLRTEEAVEPRALRHGFTGRLLLTGTTLNPLQLNTDLTMACALAHAHYCFAVLSAQLERKPVPPYTGDDADAELFVPGCACRLPIGQVSPSSRTLP